jgi:MoxR-like ATPase
MNQKHSLRNDMLLVGAPGAVKRRLVSEFCRVRGLLPPIVVSLQRDVAVSDLRDQVHLRDGALVVLPGPVLRAATEGRVLLLDALNKCDVNVLPVLHDLFESRQMPLAHGGFLLSPAAFDRLDAGAQRKFVRCSEHFLVVATAVPVPPIAAAGMPIDPPLRSRMVARYVESIGADPDLANWLPEPLEDAAVWQRVCAFAAAIRQHQFATAALDHDTLPLESMIHLALAIESGLDSASVLARILPRDVARSEAVRIATASFLLKPTTPKVVVPSRAPLSHRMVSTPAFDAALQQMLDDHRCGRDILVVGETAKTTLVQAFAQHLGLPIDTVHAHDAMSARDLLMLRTAAGGQTGWSLGPLARAAIDGRVLVLDGVYDHLQPHQVSGMLAPLVCDRRMTLPDGSVLLGAAEFDRLPEAERANYRRISPNFRIIAVSSSDKTAITLETLEMLSVVSVAFGADDTAAVLRKATGAAPTVLQTLLDSQKFAPLKLTLRQLLHCAGATLSGADDDARRALLRGALERDLLYSLLPLDKREVVDRALLELHLPPASRRPASAAALPRDFESQLAAVRASRPELVPNVGANFVPLQEHVQLIDDMTADLAMGKSLLVLGRHGLGKNFLTDVMLTKLRWPRVYVGLTSETNVASLLTQPQVVNGELVAADSPLVLAARSGCALMIDEADKSRASATLTFLRGLVDGSGVDLGDGRRLVPAALATGAREEVVIHPLFRLILIANPPEFPFHGQSLESIRHLFATHVLSSLPVEAEVQLLQRAAPNAPPDVIRALAVAFGELRDLVQRGLLAYPLSSREAIAAARHIERFPSDVLSAVESIFVHEMYDAGSRALIRSTLLKAGFAVDRAPGEGERGFLTPGAGQLVNRDVSLDSLRGPIGEPKHGKVDPNNAPHVGGNTWHGGTGGRDTAGLGGVGGPYRVDAGHTIHQVTDEVKRNVSKEVQDAARKMGAAELAKRLNEIGMSEFDFKAYTHYRPAAVVEGIAQIRSLLAALKALRDDADDADDDDDDDGGGKSRKRRGWLAGQSDGELDMTRIVDAIAGETRVFRRKAPLRDEKHWLNVVDDAAKKGENDDNDPPRAANDNDDERANTKHVRVVLDLSASMFRFNSYDRRLERLMMSALMLLEGFAGVPSVRGERTPLTFDLSGHSGDNAHIDLKRATDGRTSEQDAWRIVQTVAVHPQMCWSGDNTLEAASLATAQLHSQTMKAGDRGVVVLISDANLRRYGIAPSEVAALIERAASKRVALHFLFIADFNDEAGTLTRQLPSGFAHVCRDVAQLPETLRAILLRSLMK